jgi:hypothetical protein
MKDSHRTLSPPCPRCGGGSSHLELQRIPRRAVDRLLSAFHTIHRYRCRATGCGWVGNLAVVGHPANAAVSPPRPQQIDWQPL